MAKTLKGGYAQIDLTSTTLYTDIYNALKSNKMVICYLDGNTPFVADSIVYNDDLTPSYTITHNNTTYNVDDDNVLTITDNTPHLYLYNIDFNDGTSEDGITFPNGTYITILTNKKYSNDETLPNGEYAVIQGAFAQNNNLFYMFKIEISNGTISTTGDSGDLIVDLVTSYIGTPYLIKQF